MGNGCFLERGREGRGDRDKASSEWLIEWGAFGIYFGVHFRFFEGRTKDEWSVRFRRKRAR